MRSTLIWLFLCSVAHADIPPSPERPEWDYTPLPMPDPAVALAIVAVVLAVVAALGVAGKRRLRASIDSE